MTPVTGSETRGHYCLCDVIQRDFTKDCGPLRGPDPPRAPTHETKCCSMLIECRWIWLARRDQLETNYSMLGDFDDSSNRPTRHSDGTI